MSYSKSVEDQFLVSEYLTGNEQALERLIELHKYKVYSFIHKYVKDPELTEDLFQDTFCKVVYLLKSGKYNEKGKFLSWVLKIAHSLTMDNFRRQSNASVILSNTGKDGEAYDVFNFLIIDGINAECKIERNELRKQVRLLIANLSDEQRDVVMQRYYYDMSFKEIAALNQITINTALSRMRYALNAMRAQINVKSLVLK